MTGTCISLMILIILAIKTQRLINRFRDLGAINEENAKTQDELNMPRLLIFRKYLLYSIIIETHGKYYLNEQNLKNYKTRKRMILIPIIVILLFIFVFIYVIVQ